MIDTDKIKNLRESTGLSLARIKKALDEGKGDEAKAREILKAQGVAVAAKKSSREVSEGVVDSYIHANKKIGAIVEVLCETDFVAKNLEFQKLVHDLAMHAAATRPETIEDFLGQEFIKDPNMKIKDLIDQHIAKLGENIQIGRFEVLVI